MTTESSRQNELPADLPSRPDETYNPSRTALASSWMENVGLVDSSEDTRSRRWPPTAAEMEEPPLGARSYKVNHMIGKGGFGEVWAGLQPALNRVVALKRLRDDIYAADSGGTNTAFYEASFRHEAFSTGALEHPNIIPVYDFGVDNEGRPVLAMKRVQGVPWDELIRRDRDLDAWTFLEKHLEYLIGVARAVAFAHSRGIAHRDIKPSQVMVGEFGEVLLMDWGLAMIFDVELAERENPALRGTDNIPNPMTAPNPSGTVAFMAPEQTSREPSVIGAHTDVFLLGGTLYHLLTLSNPHPAPDPKAAFAQARLCHIDPPRERAPGRWIPEELARVALEAMASDPADRIPSAIEFIRRLQDYQTGAGKRRESVDLVKIASDRAQKAGGDYTEMAACIALVERAVGLWPDNPNALPLREQLLIDYARAALRHNDLQLARIQTNGLDDSEVKRVLLSEISSGERRSRFQKILVRGSMVLVILFLVIVSLLAVRLNRNAEAALAAQELATVEAQKATRERARAEELVSFLTEDLYRTLAPLNRLDLLDKLATRAQDYYASIPVEEMTQGTSDARTRARILDNIGDIRLGQGALEAARTSFDRVAATANELLRLEPDRTENQALLASALSQLGRVHLLTNRFPEGIAALEEALTLYNDLAVAEPREEEWPLAAAEIHSLFADISYARGDIPEAARRQQRALGILQDVRNDAAGPEVDRRLAASHAAMASLFSYQGRNHLVVSNVEKGFEYLPPSGRNLSAQAVEAELNILLAVALWRTGELAGAIAASDKAVNVLRSLEGVDPTNVEWKRNLSTALRLKSRLLRDRGDSGGAEILAETAARMSGELSRQEPENILLQAEETQNHQYAAFRLLEEGRPTAARERLEAALRIIRYQIHQDDSLTIWRHLRANVLLLMGDSWMQSSSFQEAASSYAEAADILETAAAADPENLRLGLLRAHALLGLARAREAQGDPLEAAELRRTAGEILDLLDYRGQQLPVEFMQARAEYLLTTGEMERARDDIRRLRQAGRLEGPLKKMVEERSL